MASIPQFVDLDLNGSALLNATVATAAVSDSSTAIANTAFVATGYAPKETFAVLPYAASIPLDWSGGTVRTLALAANVTFGASTNVTLLGTLEIWLTNATGATLNLSYPAGWVFFPGWSPGTLGAGKQAVLTLRSLGTADSAVKAAFAAQA